MTTPNSTASDGLKPCPFCGGKAIHIKITNSLTATTWPAVVCSGCETRTKLCADADRAAEAWNTRSLSTGTDAEVRVRVAADKLGWWLAAALEDPNVSPEMKAAINEWFAALEQQPAPTQDKASPGMEGREHVEQLVELLKLIKEHWIDYDHVFSIAVHEAEQWLAATPTGKGEASEAPDHCYDPNDWEYSMPWEDRNQLVEEWEPNKPHRVATLIDGPDKWVIILWDEENGEEIRWFDSEAEASALTAALTGKGA